MWRDESNTIEPIISVQVWYRSGEERFQAGACQRLENGGCRKGGTGMHGREWRDKGDPSTSARLPSLVPTHTRHVTHVCLTSEMMVRG